MRYLKTSGVAVFMIFNGFLFFGGCSGGEDNQTEPTPSSSVSVAGSYQLVHNECEDDGGALTIATQDGHHLTFNGGFNSAPSPYSGTIESNGNISFTNGDGTCTGTIKDGVLQGICEFPAEDCPFEYRK